MGTNEDGVQQYSLAVKAPPFLADRISIEIEKGILEGGCQIQALPPVITFGLFTATESMEDTLIRWMERVCSSASLEVSLNNYGALPPQTLLLRIQDNPFARIFREMESIRNYITSSACEVSWIARPFMKMARVQVNEFDRVMASFARKSFHESFEVEEILLLRHEAGAMRTINIFRLPPAAIYH